MSVAAVSASKAAAASRKTKFSRRRKSNIAGYMFLLPWLVGLIGLTAGPLLVSLGLSFTNYNIISSPDYIGMANYERMFTRDRLFYQSTWVTLQYVLLSVPLQLGLALGLAISLNKGIKGLTVYRGIFYLPSLLGGSVAVAILWRQLFSSDGVVNTALAWFGIQGASWIGDPRYAIYTLIIHNAWTFGSAMVIFLAGLRQIPAMYYEAAEIDGAGKIRQFFSITLPLLSPVIFFNMILQIIHAFQAFTPAYIISGGTGGPLNSTLFYTLYLYRQGFVNFEMGYASALAWVLLAAIAMLTAMNFLMARYWVHYEDA